MDYSGIVPFEQSADSSIIADFVVQLIKCSISKQLAISRLSFVISDPSYSLLSSLLSVPSMETRSSIEIDSIWFWTHQLKYAMSRRYCLARALLGLIAINFPRMLVQDSTRTRLKIQLASEFLNIAVTTVLVYANGAKFLIKSLCMEINCNRQDVSARLGERTRRFLPALGATQLRQVEFSNGLT